MTLKLPAAAIALLCVLMSAGLSLMAWTGEGFPMLRDALLAIVMMLLALFILRIGEMFS